MKTIIGKFLVLVCIVLVMIVLGSSIDKYLIEKQSQNDEIIQVLDGYIN